MIYDGYDFSALPFFKVEDINRPGTAEITTNTESYEGREGSLFNSSRREEKIIEVSIRLIRPYADVLGLDGGFEMARRLMGAKLYRDKPCLLWLHDMPDSYDMAILSGKIEFEKHVYSRTALLTFVCPNPSSFGRMYTKSSTGGKVTCMVDGNDETHPWAVVEAQGPFTIKFDGQPFEVTQSVTGDVFIDSRSRNEETTGHRVFTEDLNTVAYSVFNDWPKWKPGIHTVECSRPFAVSWRERWL